MQILGKICEHKSLPWGIWIAKGSRWVLRCCRSRSRSGAGRRIWRAYQRKRPKPVPGSLRSILKVGITLPLRILRILFALIPIKSGLSLLCPGNPWGTRFVTDSIGTCSCAVAINTNAVAGDHAMLDKQLFHVNSVWNILPLDSHTASW